MPIGIKSSRSRRDTKELSPLCSRDGSTTLTQIPVVLSPSGRAELPKADGQTEGGREGGEGTSLDDRSRETKKFQLECFSVSLPRPDEKFERQSHLRPPPSPSPTPALAQLQLSVQVGRSLFLASLSSSNAAREPRHRGRTQFLPFFLFSSFFYFELFFDRPACGSARPAPSDLLRSESRISAASQTTTTTTMTRRRLSSLSKPPFPLRNLLLVVFLFLRSCVLVQHGTCRRTPSVLHSVPFVTLFPSSFFFFHAEQRDDDDEANDRSRTGDAFDHRPLRSRLSSCSVLRDEI